MSNTGKMRSKILSLIDEIEGTEDLRGYIESCINDIESDVNTIKDKLNIEGIWELHKIEDAYSLAEELADTLY